jgi:gamma-glutamylputrescine oxidase
VLAGNVHVGKLVPRIAGTLLPVWTYVVTTASLGRRLDKAINYCGAISDTDRADNHYRIVGGDRLMWSGRATTWEIEPRRFANQLKADIERIYPQLGHIEIDHVWSGVLGHALHRMPQIGEVSPRVWVASGFGGHGINTTAMAADLIARAIDDGDDDWRLFLPFELVWAGGAIGRTAAQVHYWWHRAREQSQSRAARKREAEYRRGAEPEVRIEPGVGVEPQEPEIAPAQMPAEPMMMQEQPHGADQALPGEASYVDEPSETEAVKRDG